jgi:hypothetical protein
MAYNDGGGSTVDGGQWMGMLLEPAFLFRRFFCEYEIPP